jgi:hypothetical protein
LTCKSYTITQVTGFSGTYDYIDCEGVDDYLVPIGAGESITGCFVYCVASSIGTTVTYNGVCSGTSGSSGTSGTSGSSGTSGTSGSSGTGFNTVTNPGDNRILTSDGTSNGAVAESGLTYDGTYLTLIGAQKIQTTTQTGLTTDTTIYTLPTSGGCGAYYEYCITESATDAKRLGTVMAVWDSVGVQFTDTSTPDLNSTTGEFAWDIDISSGNVRLVAKITNGTWTVKLGVRIIY